MMRSLSATAVLALLSVPALAQTATQTATGTNTSLEYGSTWTTAIGQVFYSDADMVTLRPRADADPLWQQLPQADRDKVVQDCAQFRADANSPGGTPLQKGSAVAKEAAKDDAVTASNPPNPPPTNSESQTATDGTAPMRPQTLNDMIHLCALVQGF